MQEQSLQNSIDKQRALLHDLLSGELLKISRSIPDLMENQIELDRHLREVFGSLDNCKYIYVLDPKGIQLSSTVNRFGCDEESIGRDRASRPYMQPMDDKVDFWLSEAYISRNKKRPSLTAIQVVHGKNGERLGFVGLDFDLRELPHSDVIYEEPMQWRQMKGDPAIRGGLFHQERVESVMDRHIDDVLAMHESLMRDQGVHHCLIHFSSSRSTMWHIDDPYVYRILTVDEIADTNICLAYPHRPYFERAVVPQNQIGKILQQFKALRYADETIYLRAASLNIVNGKVGLNFSCDGTHYLNWDEFLESGLELWFGGAAFPQAVVTDEVVSEEKLEPVIENLAGDGCIQVNKLLYAMENDEVPAKVASYSKAERDYIYKELKAIMDVYDGGVCGI